MAWKEIKALGMEGEKDDEVFEGIVRDLETRGIRDKEVDNVSYIQIP